MFKKRARSLLMRAAMLIAATLPSAGWAASDPALIAAAKKEGKVIWSSGLIFNQAVRPLAAAFEKKYGIKVETTTGGDLLLKLTNEARSGARPSVDIFDGTGDTIAALRAADLIIPYVSPESHKLRPEHRDPENYWASCCIFYWTMAVNTDLVKPADEPKSHQDLLDPKWKGKMAWQADRTVAGPSSFVGMILTSMGEDAGMAYLQKLAKQDIARIPGNARTVLDQVIVGQYSMGVMSLNHHAVISAGQGAPVKWLKISPLIGTAETVSIIKNAQNPNAAKLLFDFLLSDDGQQVLKEANYLPSDPNVQAKTPDLKPKEGGFTAVQIMPAMNQTHLPKWLEIYERLFVTK